MTTVISLGTTETLNMDLWPKSSGALTLYDNFTYDYATLYRTQPNVRKAVDFLARNTAQLGLHVYRRVSDTDRERLTEHGLARTIKQPNPRTTRYRLIERLISDFHVYHRAYWLKMGAKGGRVTLLPVPPPYVTAKGGFLPSEYEINAAGLRITVEPDAIVHFRGYNPDSPIQGLSPLETLRRILAEEHAAGQWREGFWKHSARQSLIIERPATAPEWSAGSQERWRAEFESIYAGAPGRTMVLEEGMTAKAITFDPQESQYMEGRKLTALEVVTQFHIQPAMAGLLDDANFANMREQHKMLYQDTLGPTCTMVKEEIELQLLPEWPDSEGIYVEFNIQEKLKGSFEEQAQALSSAVGRPYMTADEARARMNLPAQGGEAAKLVTPLNVLIGGQASPRDSAPDRPANPSTPAGPTRRAEILARFVERQARVLRSNGGRYDAERWERELAEDLEAVGE